MAQRNTPQGRGRRVAAKLRLTGKDRAFVRERMAAALAALEKVPQVDPKSCGGRRLWRRRNGSAGTARGPRRSSKGSCACMATSLRPDDGKSVGASLLVLVGADDPVAKIPLAQVAAFEDEMRKGGRVDWQLVRYGGVAGDFTNPQAGAQHSRPGTLV